MKYYIIGYHGLYATEIYSNSRNAKKFIQDNGFDSVRIYTNNRNKKQISAAAKDETGKIFYVL